MPLKEQMQRLADEASQLLEKQKAGTFTPEDASRALEIASERTELAEKIETMEKATAALNQFPAQIQNGNSVEDEPAAKTLGERFTKSAGYQAFKGRYSTGQVPQGTSVEIRAEGQKTAPAGGRMTRKDLLTSGTTGNAGPVRVSDVDDLVHRAPRRLLDVITIGSTDTPWFEYRQVISKTNNAAIVPEATTSADIDGTEVTGRAGGLKPISSLTTQTAEAKAHTYADGIEVTNQELADDKVIATLIDSTLTENLEIAIEDILVNGAGTNDEPAGILNTTGVLQQDFAADMPTTIRKSITLLQNTSGAQIRGVLLNPQDDEAWDLLKDSHGDWIGAGPFGSGPTSAWGYERIAAQVIPVGTAIIGDFATIHLLVKEALEILAFNQHKDYAQRNLSYVRAETRALQLIRNAARLAIVDLTGN